MATAFSNFAWDMLVVVVDLKERLDRWLHDNLLIR